jgi:hypothetical protein
MILGESIESRIGLHKCSDLHFHLSCSFHQVIRHIKPGRQCGLSRRGINMMGTLNVLPTFPTDAHEGVYVLAGLGKKGRMWLLNNEGEVHQLPR